MIGTENVLAGRAATPEVAEKIRYIIEAEELEVRKWLGPEASRIIARGNIAGGLTTIQEQVRSWTCWNTVCPLKAEKDSLSCAAPAMIRFP